IDYCHAILSPEHSDAAAEGLRDTGIRALLAYDLEARDPAGNSSLAPSSARFDDVARLYDRHNQENSLVTIGVGLSNVSIDRVPRLRNEINFARELGIRMTFHNNQ